MSFRIPKRILFFLWMISQCFSTMASGKGINIMNSPLVGFKINVKCILLFYARHQNIQYFVLVNPLEQSRKELIGKTAGINEAVPSLSNKGKRMLPVNRDESISSVPETKESYEEIVAVKNRVNIACQNLTKQSPNDEVTRAICQILLGELDRQLQSILRQNGILVSPMPSKEKQLSWMVTKRVDGSMLKFPLRQRQQPRITLNQAIYLADGICPHLMETGDPVIADICEKAKILVQQWSSFLMDHH